MYLTIKRTMIAGFALTAMFVAACTAENKSPPTTSVLTDSSEIASGVPQSTQMSKEALQALGEEIGSWVESGDPIGAEILTFDAVNDEVLKYRFEAGDGWEAEFTRQ